MVRPGGLASEHHPVGPGDAPRRKKGRKTRTASVDVTMTTAMKRPASPTPEPSQSKRKRVQIDDHDQITRELEDAILREQDNDTIAVGGPSNTRRNRRLSEPVVLVHNEEDDSQNTPPHTQPLPGLTPHLERVGAARGRAINAARRVRMSMPAQLSVDANQDEKELQFHPLRADVLDGRTRRRLRRSHLSEEINEIEEDKKEKKKLRQAYAELRRQVREKDDVIKELEYQLEARKLGEIDMSEDRAQELEQELSQAREEIYALRASSIYGGDSREQSAVDNGAGIYEDDEDEPVVLTDHEDVGMSHVDVEPLSSGEYTTRALALSSQVTVDSLTTMTQTTYDALAEPSQSAPESVPDKISDKAVKRFEMELERLTSQLAEAQGGLRVIAIELQNLHVLAPGASSQAIVTELRHSFETVREQLEKLLPNSTVGVTNSELLRKIPDILTGLLGELREKALMADKYHQRERKLHTQVDNVLDLLAVSETQNQGLEDEINDLRESNESHLNKIADLEERVLTLTNLVDEQEEQLQQNNANIHGLRDELSDKDTAVKRLQDSIDSYREELNKVTETATLLEREHGEKIAQMTQEHANVVQDLETQLAAESEAREAAEDDAQQKSDYIDELERRIEGLEEDLNAFTDQMKELRACLDTETTKRQEAEAERDEQTAKVYEHANTIENLQEAITDLRAEITDFQTNLAAEREQREQTEASLDTANEDIADLTARLHDAGVQANELRSKLFEVQQERTQAMAELREELQQREAEMEDSYTQESAARQAAEKRVSDLEANKADLEMQLDNLQDTIVQLTADRKELEKDRDERIASLSSQLQDLQQKFAALENSTQSEIATLNASITDLINQNRSLQSEKERIAQQADETERKLRDEVVEKNLQIADLERDLSASRDENAKLTTENGSLASRLEEEAMELLNIQGSHQEESNLLRTTIKTQDATIKNLQNAAAELAREHESLLAEKNAEITDLRVICDARVEHIAALDAEIDELKERFRQAEEDSRTTIDALLEAQHVLQQRNEQLAAEHRKRQADALQAVKEMKVKGVEVRAKGVDLHKVTNGKVGKVSDKVKIGKKSGRKEKKVVKRQWDSGFGVDERIENGEAGEEVGEEEALVG